MAVVTAQNLSVVVAVLALVLTTLLLARQARAMEHERNAMAILEAIERVTDERMVAIFDRLADVNERYSTDDELRTRYKGSQDERDFMAVAQFIETVACLARRKVLDASLIVDAVGLPIRARWASIKTFIDRRRRVEHNEYILENFEWLAMYSAWWKDTPRPRFDRNYNPRQFSSVSFRV
ncbi:MAG: DUF4760 domain-containing protein [Candidatus Eremiobacteraeota bacterium]|nr:DUF4760 domain-containing protein [Candidatus Eremiobacteraeota bacterium]